MKAQLHFRNAADGERTTKIAHKFKQIELEIVHSAPRVDGFKIYHELHVCNGTFDQKVEHSLRNKCQCDFYDSFHFRALFIAYSHFMRGISNQIIKSINMQWFSSQEIVSFFQTLAQGV